MKASIVLAALLTMAAATNPFVARADCTCDISKCPTSGSASCKCITGLLDACYVAQTNAGIDCGKPQYPAGCSSSTPIQNQACGGTTNNSCGTNQICYVPDKSCDIHSGKCTGLCASDYCGGRWEKECADDRWSCVYDDACLKNGGNDCDGKCVLN